MAIRWRACIAEWICIISTRHRILPSWALYPLGLVPAAWLLWRGVQGDLGADPVGTFEKQLGLWAVRFLALSLLVSPIRWVSRLNLLRYRRALGLLAFIYAGLHVLTYVWLDIGLNMHILLRDLTRRPFMIFGLSALLILSVLALTSNRWSIKRLRKNWSRVHALVYAAAILAGIHLFMAFKRPTQTSVFYDCVLLALLLARPAHRFWMRRSRAGSVRPRGR